MENCLNKYFADEFTSDEKTEFLIEVEKQRKAEGRIYRKSEFAGTR